MDHSSQTRYSEAGLVKELEKRGIGRPSTYAAIIKTIIDRGYVDKDGKALKPTETGEVVDDFLASHFSEIVSDVFTADMESKLDDIANGDREYEKTLKAFYVPFAKEVKSKDKIDKVTNMGDAPVGTVCPKCGKKYGGKNWPRMASFCHVLLSPSAPVPALSMASSSRVRKKQARLVQTVKTASS
jgi:hypothetical protein